MNTQEPTSKLWLMFHRVGSFETGVPQRPQQRDWCISFIASLAKDHKSNQSTLGYGRFRTCKSHDAAAAFPKAILGKLGCIRLV